MERNTSNNDGEDLELEDLSPSQRQKKVPPRTRSSDVSLHSVPASDDAAESFKTYTEAEEEEEKAVVRKLDRRLVLFLAFLYMLSFLDRSSKYNKRIYRKKDWSGLHSHGSYTERFQILEMRG